MTARCLVSKVRNGLLVTVVSLLLAAPLVAAECVFRRAGDVSPLMTPRPHYQGIDIPRSPEAAKHTGPLRLCAFIDETQSSNVPRIEDTAELEANVGMMAAVKGVVLPGTELTVRKVDPRSSAVMLRIDNVYSHGDGFRYDLTWMAYEPGPHNLMEYLVRKDGSEMASLPALNVTAVSVLKNEGSQLNPLQTERNASAGGYRTTLMVGGLLWLIGLGFLISRGWQNRLKKPVAAEDTPITRLQQIEAQLLAAVSQPESLSAAAKAKLESLIVAFWRDEKQLSHHDPNVAISTLRQDPDAGPLLAVLERWLYDRPERSDFDGDALLAPFRRYAERQQMSVLSNSVGQPSSAESRIVASKVATGADGHG